MQPSIAGALICAGLLAFACWPTRSLFVGLAASLAFGATAVATLSSLGGSSPLIYTIFAALVLATVPLRRHIRGDIGIVFRHSYVSWVVCALIIYAAAGALLFPRVFAGHTTVFVASHAHGGVYEVPLGPVSGNISQTGYFIIGCLAYLALCVTFLQDDAYRKIRTGLFVWCVLHTGLGLADLCGKLVGLGDVLAFLRTASYAMITEATQAGFARIAGAQSEASAFGGMSLMALAFTYTFWRRTGSRLALGLSLVLIALLVLSTSSTAYVGLAVLAIPVALSTIRSLSRKRLHAQEILLVGLGMLGVFAFLAAAVHDDDFTDPIMRLLNKAIFDKASSSSAQERAYWNYTSLKSFVDTFGLGVGLGSSRASSWLVAVLSQLGLAGSLILALLVTAIARRPKAIDDALDPIDAATVDATRACALAGLVAGSLISGTADPGMFFFVALAVVTSTSIRMSLERKAPVAARPTRPAIGFAAGTAGATAIPM